MAQSPPAWVLGFEDEVCWSRLAQPPVPTWTTDQPVQLVQREAGTDAPEPKALACYGLLCADPNQVWLRFVDGRPVSAITIQFLSWVVEPRQQEGQQALLLVWDNASWQHSHAVWAWLKAHNRHAKWEGGVRILGCPLPSKRPWLNRIEPKWVHGKRAVAEPDRKLQGSELKQRLCAYYQCELLAPLTQQVL